MNKEAKNITNQVSYHLQQNTKTKSKYDKPRLLNLHKSDHHLD